MLDIAELADRAPFQLSGGQKKRVAIASVLVMNPEVLLFDEPTAALDPRTQHWLIELLAQLRAAGKTIVLATHDLESCPTWPTGASCSARTTGSSPTRRPTRCWPTPTCCCEVNLIHEHSRLASAAIRHSLPHQH